MSDQAAKFLAQWEFEHITVAARSDREERARRLALQYWKNAIRAGISREDLEAAVEGNLFDNMLQALNAAEFRQIYRDQIADQEGGA